MDFILWNVHHIQTIMFPTIKKNHHNDFHQNPEDQNQILREINELDLTDYLNIMGHCFQKFDFGYHFCVEASDLAKKMRKIRICCGEALFIVSVEISRLVGPRISLFCSSGHEKIASALICNATCLTKD